MTPCTGHHCSFRKPRAGNPSDKDVNRLADLNLWQLEETRRLRSLVQQFEYRSQLLRASIKFSSQHRSKINAQFNTMSILRAQANTISTQFVSKPHLNPLPKSLTIIRMENQSSHLNTLPRSLIDSLRVRKRRMRHTPRPTINLRIKALNQRHQIRSLRISVIPLNIRIGLDGIRLAFPVRVDELDGYKIAIWDGVRVCYRQRISEDCLDGTPDIDDLVSAFEELWGVFG